MMIINQTIIDGQETVLMTQQELKDLSYVLDFATNQMPKQGIYPGGEEMSNRLVLMMNELVYEYYKKYHPTLPIPPGRTLFTR